MADPLRVVLIGKSGSGKSSLANTIFGTDTFKVNHGSDSKSQFSIARTGTVGGLNLTFIDTPGIFNTDRTQDDVALEIYSCFVQSAPGPHAFLLVLMVEKFTEQEQAIVDEIVKHFGEGVFRHATVVFTHGDQLQEGTEITEFVGQSPGLTDLVGKCGGRCTVVDNKYWKTGGDPYRSNGVQVGKILSAIQSTVRGNDGKSFTNKSLESVETKLQNEESRGASREEAQEIVLQKYITSQKIWRYTKCFVIVGLSVAALGIAGSFVFRWLFWGRGVSASSPYASDAPPPSVMEVVQEVVEPIKSTLDYIIETVEAIFVTKRPALPNKTVTEL